MRHRLRLIVLVLGVCALMGIAAFALVYKSGSHLASFQQAAAHPDQLTVYEGLPHQFYEQDEYQHERKSKEVFELRAYPFYKTPLPIDPDDEKALAAILAKPSTWRPFSGEKECGGFHPDYAVQLISKGVQYTALLCFGCSEGKVFIRGVEERFDLSLEPRKVLKKYRKNRPATDYDPE